MLGAIVGDIVGSIYEFNNIRRKDFELFSPRCFVTDDSIMTLAIAQALVESYPTYESLQESVIHWMKLLGHMYPSAGYGSHFEMWIFSRQTNSYNSCGNGSAMRVSPVSYAGNTIEQVIELSQIVTAVTHDHPEGLKGAEATAVAIYMARMGESLDTIRQHILEHYYTIDFTCDELRNSYTFDGTCQGTVPQAMQCFFESHSFEDAIRNSISIGGDSDTIGAIAGSIAGAYYGIPEDIAHIASNYMDERQKEILHNFEIKFMR